MAAGGVESGVWAGGVSSGAGATLWAGGALWPGPGVYTGTVISGVLSSAGGVSSGAGRRLSVEAGPEGALVPSTPAAPQPVRIKSSKSSGSSLSMGLAPFLREMGFSYCIPPAAGLQQQPYYK